MISLRRPRLLAIGLPVLLALFALNHLEYHHRQAVLNARGQGQNQVMVRAGGGSTGHNTITIDESSVSDAGDGLFLHFAMLGAWAFDPRAKTPCPEKLKALSGREASCIGFMYPLEAGEKVKVFCLLRSTQTCCYGPRPQYNQYLYVEMREPVKFERLVPVLLKGKFIVDPQPDQGFIYRMEGTSVSTVGDDGPEIDAAVAARKARLPRFDYQPLAAFEKNQAKGLPPGLVALDGKQVVLDGYLVDRSKDMPPHLLVSSKWWDGVSQGTPPTLYNAVMVFPKDGGQVPPLWKQKGAFTGTLRLAKNPSEWPRSGIVSLRDSILGVPGTTTIKAVKDAGPYFSMFAECIILIVFLMITLGPGRKDNIPLSFTA